MEAPMSELKTSTAEILVHLVRPGVAKQDYHLAAGATVGDLVRLSQTSMENQAIFVDGVPLEETLPLHEGASVTIVPRPRNAAGAEPWRASIPAFQDEALFQEYSETVRDRRQEINPREEAQEG
jgi:hypothetical protein